MVSREFVLGGRAVFTVDNGKGTHYTYKVRAKESKFRAGQTVFFVSINRDLGNTGRHFAYIGMVLPNGTIRLTGKSTVGEDAVEFKVAAWALAMIWTGGTLPDGYAIHHEGTCGRCGKALTHPESIQSGFGPDCIKLMPRFASRLAA